MRLIIEKLIRILNKEIIYYDMLVLEFVVKSIQIKNQTHFVKVFNNTELISSQEVCFDFINKKATFKNSHEDPLIFNEDFLLLTTQIPIDKLKNMNSDFFHLQFINLNGDIILEEKIKIPLNQLNGYNDSHYSNLSQYHVQSQKDAILTFHLGNEMGLYEEKVVEYKANEIIDIKPYINDAYSYIGIQFSYENEFPEIEEKYIVRGQKGMKYTQRINFKNIQYQPILDLSDIYQHESDDKLWKTDIYNIDELIDFYQIKGLSNSSFFESNFHFLSPFYKRAQTIYSQTKILGPIKTDFLKHHIDLNICQQCNHNVKCMQAIPSGLSSQLFKKNLALQDFKECAIYDIIDLAKDNL